MRSLLRPRIGAALAVLALVCGGAVALARLQHRADPDLEVTVFRTGSPSRVPVLHAHTRNGSPDAPVAFLVHGFQCNKSMMALLAKDLALNGVDAYAIDLPGHGASAQRFSEERAHAVAKEALEWILAERRTDPARVTLIGHSYGAKVVGQIASEDGRYPTTILVGPAYGGRFTRSLPRNLLVLTAERDSPQIVAFATAIAQDATGGAAGGPFARIGDASRGDARRWREIPGADHLSLLFSPDVRREVIGWIDLSMRRPRAEPHLASIRAPIALSLLALAAAFALAALAGRASRGLLAPPAREPVAARLRPAAVAVVAVAVALLCARVSTPLRFLRIAEGDVVASVLFVAGAAVSALALVVCREYLPTISQVLRGLPVALVAAVIVFLVAAPLASRELYNLSLGEAPGERFASAVVLAICVFPFFAFSEAVLDGIRRSNGNGPLAHLRAVALAAPFCAALGWSLALASPTLGRFAAAIAVAATCCSALAGILSASAANFAAGAGFSAIATAWIVAVGFARY